MTKNAAAFRPSRTETIVLHQTDEKPQSAYVSRVGRRNKLAQTALNITTHFDLWCIASTDTMNSFSSKQNGYVQSNSVQSQFTALSREREIFHRAKEEADADHKRTQARLQQLKGGQTSLMTQIRGIQEELGTLTRKQALLKQEQARVDRVLKGERKALEDCALHTQGLEQQERGRTKHYCRELGELNDETANLLQRQLNARTEALLSVESVEDVVLTDKIPQSVNEDDFLSKMALMKEAKVIWERSLDRYNKVSSTTQSAVEGQGGHAVVDSMDTGENVNDSGANPVSQQMDLFYGPGARDNVEEGHPVD
jgi:hypothetical protein